MPQRDIPGFYWDENLKRYFKILANSSLGSQHPHSAESVRKKLKIEEKTEIKSTRRYRNFFLEREMNDYPDNLVQLHQHTVYFNSIPSSLWDFFSNQGPIVQFCLLQKPSGNYLIVATEYLLTAQKVKCSENGEKFFESATSYDLYATRSKFISMDSNRQSIIAISLTPYQDSNSIIRLDNSDIDNGLGGIAISGVSSLVNSSAVCIKLFDLFGDYAIGLDNRIKFYIDGESYNTYETWSHVLATDWKINLLVAGCRDGLLHIIKFNQRSALDSYLIQTQCKGIGNIKILNKNQVIISGVNNRIHLYSLENSILWKQNYVSYKGKPPKSPLKPQEPLIIFQGHKNEALVPPFQLGFCVNPSETLIAVAGEDFFVRIWTINGKLIQIIKPNMKILQPITTILFDNDWELNNISKSTKGRLGIWIGYGKWIEWWSI